MIEYPQHAKAKQRIYNLIDSLNRDAIIAYEYVYHNPNNENGDLMWEWKFDVYFQIDGKEYAIEVDGKKGHNSKRSKEKRDFKREYLKTKGVHLFGWPTKWLVGRKALPDSVFLDELHLTSKQKEVKEEWFNVYSLKE